ITELSEVLGGPKKKTTSGGGARAQSALRREVNFQKYLERVQPQEIAVFTRQLGTLLNAGIPLAEALGALSEQSENKKLNQILAGIRQKVNEGTSMGDALAEHPTLFEDLYVNMVRSGDAAGNLEPVMMRLADFLDAQQALRAEVSGALTYPIIMSILGSIVMGVLLIVVV